MENRFLFRGKRIDNSEWIVGNLIQTDDGVYIIQNYVPQHSIKNCEVDPSTVCQCTGLKDKNGKLIFENDIMEAHIDEDFPEDVSRFKVEWNGKGWVENHPDGVDREYLDDFDTEHFKVVGNIFDNPELLEG